MYCRKLLGKVGLGACSPLVLGGLATLGWSHQPTQFLSHALLCGSGAQEAPVFNKIQGGQREAGVESGFRATGFVQQKT